MSRRRQFPLWRATLVAKRKLAKAHRMGRDDKRNWEHHAVGDTFIFQADSIRHARELSAYRFGFNPSQPDQQRLIEDQIEVLPI